MNHLTTNHAPRTLAALGAASVLVFVMLLFLANTGEAAVVRMGSEYTLEADSSIQNDAYFVGETITTHGSTSEDILVVASTANLSGLIGGDALVIAGKAIINPEYVEGDVRVVAAELTLSTRVAEDAVILGGNIILSEETHIEGDLIIYADYLEINGTVQGHIEAHARSIVVRGTLLGPAEFIARESFTVTGDAHIAERITYSAPREAVISDTVTVDGTITYTPRAKHTQDSEIEWVGALLGALMALVAGVLLLKIFPVFTRRATERTLKNNGSVALVGLGVLILTPLVAFSVGVTLIGIVPALVLVCLYGIGTLVAFALSSVLAGAILARWVKKEDGQTWAWVSLGAFTLSFITLLPVIGFFVRLLVFLAALGTLAQCAYEGIWKTRNGTVTSDGEEKKTNTSPVSETHEANQPKEEKANQPAQN